MKTAINRATIFLREFDIIKRFFTKNSPHPHAAILFAEWVLGEQAQSFLATTLGKGTAVKGVKSKYQEFQVQPDYVVTPKLGPKLNDYLKEFRQIMGIQ